MKQDLRAIAHLLGRLKENTSLQFETETGSLYYVIPHLPKALF